MKYDFSIIFTRPNVDANVDAKPVQRQEWILEYLRKNNKIKSKIIQEKFKISKEIASRDLKKLGEKIILKGGKQHMVRTKIEKARVCTNCQYSFKIITFKIKLLKIKERSSKYLT